MAENTTPKKYLSLGGLTEYDSLIKEYTDKQIANIPSVDAYTKAEIDNYKLITDADIDTICGVSANNQ